jgi:hypothetical protein
MASTVVESSPPLKSTTALGVILFDFLSIQFTIHKQTKAFNNNTSYHASFADNPTWSQY